MSKEDFAKIMVVLKTAYPNSNLIPDDASKNFWYEKLKNMEFESLLSLTYKYVEKWKFPPSIAEIYEMYYGQAYPRWTREWLKLLGGARIKELNEPGRYAIKIITRDYFENCQAAPGKLMQCMKEFERFYKEFTFMSDDEKRQFIQIVDSQSPLVAIGKTADTAEEELVGDDWWK